MNRCKAIALCALSLYAVTIQASDIEATTPDGRKVILRDDGTWSFQAAAQTATRGLTARPAGATSVLQSKKGFMELWYDPTRWVQRSNTMNDSAEFTLEHSAGDGYVMAIVERIAIPYESLPGIALANARSSAPDARVSLQEERTVNGVKLHVLQTDGSIDGIPFRYYGYYWSGKAGTLQVIAFTSQNLFDEMAGDFTGLLNGIVITKE